ncbi:putative periplasmic protein kinase ArgK and related GTPases of G3E family [Desulfurella amilsii]|uniref:Putative periplasmic protein kinase ArgK and related GTPases of G3E family n=1 Tax=Desulfurella amilsii TaxID=1562698 RepID=A0A1X4XWP6_9BACT|nr:methylmalonyl Co-A mutase-associated GTPase MeaB [Desulfurella amilsii]OSS41956.1 putative periplasmic protein kinase ArgK and related GTPases of G3E family [Desulfurella amilsii]
MSQNQEIQKLVDGVLNKHTRYIAKAISFVENSDYKTKKSFLKTIFPYTGKAKVIGITGSPGAGKSTITDKLIRTFRDDNKSVAVLAVDPSSPFTKGALLGDRIRMQNHTTDPFVYLRSMASRGALGGLSEATKDALKVLDAAGFDIIIIETVGVGQSEIDIVKIADCVALVFAPGFGDEIQAMKAGIMEIADIYVINKADRDFSQKLFKEISDIVNLSPKQPKPSVLKTIATNAFKESGIELLKNEILSYLGHIETSSNLTKKRQSFIESELIDTVTKIMIDKVLSNQNVKNFFDSKTIAQIYNKELNFYAIIDKIVEAI